MKINELPVDIIILIFNFIYNNDGILNLRIVNKLFNKCLTPCPMYNRNKLLYLIYFKKKKIIWINKLNKNIYKEIIFGNYGDIRMNIYNDFLTSKYEYDLPNYIYKTEKYMNYYKKYTYDIKKNQIHTNTVSYTHLGCLIT